MDENRCKYSFNDDLESNVCQSGRRAPSSLLKGMFRSTEGGREGANEPKKVDGRRGASERARGGGRAPGGRSRAVVAAGKRGD